MTGADIANGENVVHCALARLRSMDGLVAAALVEPNSAQVLETVEAGGGKVSVSTTLAAGATDVVQVIGLMTASLGDPDELEDVIITLGQRHHLITALPTSGADGLLIIVTLDRAHTNLAMARQQLRALGPLLETPATPGQVSGAAPFSRVY